jgi:hypothetical protein
MSFLSLSTKECLKQATTINFQTPGPIIYSTSVIHKETALNSNNNFVSRFSHVFDLIPGLISVTSNPVGIRIQPNFIAGTTEPVPIRYSESCCRPTVEIRATDGRGNINTRWINAGMSTQTATTHAVCVFILPIVHGQAA